MPSKLSRGEVAGFALIWGGLPVAAFVGWWSFLFLVVGCPLLFISQARRHRRELAEIRRGYTYDL